MKPELVEGRGRKTGETAGRWSAASVYRRSEGRSKAKGDGKVQAEARSRQLESVAAHPVSELLDCPPDIGGLLAASAQTMSFDAGDTIFRQSAECAGLYLVVQGQLMRRTERQETRILLGTARPGDLVELAATLGDGHHTYTLVAQSPGSLLLLAMHPLKLAFEGHPPLRMRLLEELAREVSRAYHTCSLSGRGRRRRVAAVPSAG